MSRPVPKIAPAIFGRIFLEIGLSPVRVILRKAADSGGIARQYALTLIRLTQRQGAAPFPKGPTMSEQTITLLPLSRLHAHPDNPRENLGDLTDLVASVKAQGLIAPVLVVPGPVVQDGDRDVPTFVLVAGHRRAEAARQAGLSEVPGIVRTDLDEAAQTEVMLVENVQRADLTPMEQAKGLQRLADLGLTQRQIAERTGIAQGTVSKRLALLNLPTSVAKSVDSGGISVKDAEALAALAKKGDGKVVQAAARFVAQGVKGDDAVKQAQAEAAKAAKIEGAHEDAKAAGATPPDAKQAARLHNLPTVAAKDAKKHAGHLLYKVDAWNGDLRFYCGKPTAHPKPKAEQDAAAAEKAAKEAAKAQAEQVQAEREAGALVRSQLAVAVLAKWDARRCEGFATSALLARYNVGGEAYIPGRTLDPLAWALEACGVDVAGDAPKAATLWLSAQKPTTVARFSALVVLGEAESDLVEALKARPVMPVTSARFGAYFGLIGYEPKASEWQSAAAPPADEAPADEAPADEAFEPEREPEDADQAFEPEAEQE
jgi:ParB/RepB/Spo0J family partition protein